MTKQQEITHLDNFIKSVPKDSYLRGIFAGVLETVSRGIMDDIEYPVVSEMASNRARALEIQKEIEERKQRLHELKNEIARLETTRAKMISGLNEITTCAREILTAHPKIVGADVVRYSAA